ncbi:unnamed protein product [Lactuca saligna]|uniref:SWIM-type domain-containing protein n=1 Tax=Lactuca saligna TaxID=75948 RepID=A0AA36EMS5_LACSI|nr:unnamed protein product [Lactuca saligna]
MRFKDPSQLKSMLCNYVVAKGYQLCFEKNDRKRLLVKCCKGIRKGELLCDVGRDANIRNYPIAWAVVCVENKEDWRWFLDLLIDDLRLNLGYGYNVISDQHKSIGGVPNILAKTCRKRYSGVQYESIFWKACKATTEEEANHHHVRGVEDVYDGEGVQQEIGLNQFEVRGTTDAYEVDLEERTCSWRLWQLNGIGCVHSVAIISFMNRDAESYVDKMFSSITYMKAYKFRLAPMNGSNLWPVTDYTPPLPPVRRTMPGIPATKRKMDATKNPNQSTKKSKKTTQTQNKGKEQVKGVIEAVNDDGGAVNDGGEAINEVHVQQDYDEVELTPLEFDTSTNREPSQVYVQEQEARETPVATMFKKIQEEEI